MGSIVLDWDTGANKSWADMMEEEEEAKVEKEQKPDELFEMMDKSSRDGFNLDFKKAFSLGAENSQSSNGDDDSKGVKRISQKISNRPLKLQKLDTEEQEKSDSLEPRIAVVTKEEQKAKKEEKTPPSVFRAISYRDALIGSTAEKDAKSENILTASEKAPLQQVETHSETSSITDNSDIEGREHVDDSDLGTEGEEGTEDSKESHQGSLEGSPNSKQETSKGELRGRRTNERETNEIRLAQRDKQLRIGKNTPEYKAYKESSAELPKDRKRIHTPDKYQIISKRGWEGQVAKWRKNLHRFYEDSIVPNEEQPQAAAEEHSKKETGETSC